MAAHIPQGPRSDSPSGDGNDRDPWGQLRSFIEDCHRSGDAGPLSRGAWEPCYAAWAALLLRSARAYRCDGAEPEDQAQDAWLRIVRAYRRFGFDPSSGPLRQWLQAVALRSHLNQVARFQRHPLARLAADAESQVVDQAAQPADTIEQAEACALVRALLERLKSQVSQRGHEVLWRHSMEGEHFGPIAADLGITEKCARDIHRRVFKKFRTLVLREAAARDLRDG